MGRAAVIVVLVLLASACAAPAPTPPSAVPTPSAAPAVARCSPSHPAPSGDLVELYFPCGGPPELHRVIRGVTARGNERVAEVVRLFLEGPNQQERSVGFTSLLTPRDVDVVEIADGRLVLDFRDKVPNMSTAAGNDAVLDGLRRSLLGTEGIEEIELRLQGDCALFFAWIQAGHACQVLTSNGFAAGPSPSPALAYPVPPSAPTGPEVTMRPRVHAEDGDASFRLTLEASQDRYRAGQAIAIVATLTYLGPDAEAVARGSSHALVGFELEGGDPVVTINPAFTTDCSPQPLTRAVPVAFPFAKSGSSSENDPDIAFRRAYFADPVLRLPAGRWTVTAVTSFGSGADCGDEPHSLDASITIAVEP